ncbi:TlpA family protein disulfide reductase [Luteolibacter pohnpeiensis]|uniref:TlpA family protein disulfide reductase n=1 Tax=Luteolibacter pohnpeiensis TaxID=454153 RepID=A0A934VVU1_9BACT|nr:redoxin domain-containing protein [Luteolibacter pohnpeiensis]MBK1882575.1 TlpA family protein disulfide reductase [Luteolibacter pohnpeiensis]
MNRFTRLFPLISLFLTAVAHATPQEAASIEKEYKLAVEKWQLQLKIASKPEERITAWKARPNDSSYADRMWQAIQDSLAQDWSIEPSTWFIQLASGIIKTNQDGMVTSKYTEEVNKIMSATESYHTKSDKIGPLCLALVAGGNPRSLSLLEQIQTQNPDLKVQGVAALASAMLLRTIGDENEITRKRLNLLRKAIVQSADVEINGTTVAKLAEDELYIIRYLTKGRVAPDLTGTDSAGRPITLSSQEGKVVVLLFWNSGVIDAQHMIEICSGMAQKYKNRPFALIGVNSDPLQKLRSMEADGTVNWRNFSDPQNQLANEYRVGTMPVAYVLDGKRTIQFVGLPGSFVDLSVEALLSETH